MSLPIYIQGLPCGELNEKGEGLYTLFSADCEPREGLIRLWAHGGGRSACLGLLAPEGGRLRLTRRLSRRERASFPSPIERVDDRADEAAPEPQKEPQKEPPAAVSAPEAPKEEPAAADAEAPPIPGAPVWLALPDGTLLGPDGEQAIPASLPPSSPLFTHLRRIQGRDYLVFHP